MSASVSWRPPAACRASECTLQPHRWRPSSGTSSRRRSLRRAHLAPLAAADTGGSIGGDAASAAVRQVLDSRQRSKIDLGDDRLFYSTPRYVHHLDARFRAQLTQLYRERIPEGADILDLCSSWVSHLPADRQYGRVTGHGLNAAELGRNPRLTDFFVRNLNAQPTGWALGDASVDAVLCVAGLQYMQQPEAVLGEVARVLRPGGVLIVAFTNRMFYGKAIAAWRDSTDFGRCSLVKSLILASGALGEPEVVRGVPLPGQRPLQQLQQWAEAALAGGASDPFFAVVARRL